MIDTIYAVGFHIKNYVPCNTPIVQLKYNENKQVYESVDLNLWIPNTGLYVAVDNEYHKMEELDFKDIKIDSSIVFGETQLDLVEMMVYGFKVYHILQQVVDTYLDEVDETDYQ